jgi:hypothetical protein|uniref:Uncharacterized protein n=2 Tax=Picea TaxID=3328 RepID=A0A101M1B2_PICGL|nr:hypothetical protein ABT39_MTgene3653 [Picea glauca]QHR92835.1 hypothetical protein Q903MT_gene6883 [Picea sitchensis]
MEGIHLALSLLMGKWIRLLSLDLDLGMDLLLDMGLDLWLDHEHETQVLTLNNEN